MKLWKKSMVWALCLAMSVAAASCFGTESDSSGSDISESVAESTESVASESTPEESDEGGDQGGEEGGETPGGDQGGEEGGETPGGDQGGEEGGETPGGDQGGEEGGETPGGDQGGEEGGETPGGNEGGEEGGEQGGEPEKVMCTVTFKQEGCEDIVKTVEQGTALTDIPTPVGKTGYTVVWSVVDFSNISDNMEVTAEAIAKMYTISYDAKGGSAESPKQVVTFDEEYTVADPATRDYYTFAGWYVVEDGVVTDTQFVDGVWTTDGDVEVAAKWTFEEGEYSMKYNFNVKDYPLTQITKAAYPGGSKVSFEYYIPEGTTAGWWGIAWNIDADKADNYNAAGIYPDGSPYSDCYKLSDTTGTWVKAEFTLPEGNDYFLYFGSEMGAGEGHWLLGEGNSYALIDNFKVGEVKEDFNKGIDDSIFAVNVAGAVSVGEGVMPFEEGEYAMKILLNKGDDGIRAVTTQAYAGGSTVEFMYYFQADEATSWTRFIWDADNSNGFYNYEDTYADFGNTAGQWVKWSYTLPAGGPYYLYLGFECGHWADSSGEPYVLIDNFTVNGEVETFNQGVDNSIFTILQPAFAGNSAKGAGYVAPAIEEYEYAMKILLNNGNDGVRAVTKKAYAGGSTVEFMYYFQADQKTQWTRFIWDADNSNGYDNYEDTYTSFGNTAGQWVKWSYTLPEGGPYYLYFGFECGNWADSSGAPYVLIDNFTVNGEVETFNKGVDNSIFNVLQPEFVGNSAIDEGYVEVVIESYGAKIMLDSISGTKTTPSFISKTSYSGVATVTFDCYITGNPNNKWWALNWTNDKSHADIYAFDNNPSNTSENWSGKQLTTENQGTWQTITVEIPEGEWYFFIAGAKGEWGDGYVIIDNVVLKDAEGNVIASENFENGYGIFENNRATSIFLVEGKVNN